MPVVFTFVSGAPILLPDRLAYYYCRRIGCDVTGKGDSCTLRCVRLVVVVSRVCVCVYVCN